MRNEICKYPQFKKEILKIDTLTYLKCVCACVRARAPTHTHIHFAKCQSHDQVPRQLALLEAETISVPVNKGLKSLLNLYY